MGPCGINLPVFINAKISGVIGRAALMRTGAGCCPPSPATHLLLFLLTALHLFQFPQAPSARVGSAPSELSTDLSHSFLIPPLVQPIPRPRESPGLSLTDCRPGAGPFAARRPWFWSGKGRIGGSSAPSRRNLPASPNCNDPCVLTGVHHGSRTH